MKTPNDYPLVKFRPGKVLTEILSLRSSEQTDSAFSQTAKEDLSDYYALLRLCLPTFTHAEREVLIQALHGWLATASGVSQHDVMDLWVEVDALVGIYERAGVDIPRLVERLKNLSRFECWCVYQAVRYGFGEER